MNYRELDELLDQRLFKDTHPIGEVWGSNCNVAHRGSGLFDYTANIMCEVVRTKRKDVTVYQYKKLFLLWGLDW